MRRERSQARTRFRRSVMKITKTVTVTGDSQVGHSSPPWLWLYAPGRSERLNSSHRPGAFFDVSPLTRFADTAKRTSNRHATRAAVKNLAHATRKTKRRAVSTAYPPPGPGNLRVPTTPPSVAFARFTEPPCSVMIDRTMARPRPAPSVLDRPLAPR
jgi:hypothetical protein